MGKTSEFTRAAAAALGAGGSSGANVVTSGGSNSGTVMRVPLAAAADSGGNELGKIGSATGRGGQRGALASVHRPSITVGEAAGGSGSRQGGGIVGSVGGNGSGALGSGAIGPGGFLPGGQHWTSLLNTNNTMMTTRCV